MQGSIFQELIDFTGLRRKPEEPVSGPLKNECSNQANDLDAATNEMIMKSFRELREKLKSSQRQTQYLRQQLKSLQVQTIHLQDSENNLRTINHQIKDKNHHLEQATEQLKKKVAIMKISLSEKTQLQRQLQFIKDKVVQLQLKCEKLEAQNKQIISLSIEEKLSLQHEHNQLILKQKSDHSYIQDMEQEVTKSHELILKLENQLKKAQIKYDQEIFNKQWSKEHFKAQKHESYIKELENQLLSLRTKLRKDKEKYSEIEKRVIELQQISGLWNVKAQAYEGEVDLMTKRVQKMERRMSQAKNAAFKMSNQKINWEERFYKVSSIAEELINRVKRDLLGDVVQLAKTCEFRLNKLKQYRDPQVMRYSNTKDKKLFNKSIRKSNKKIRQVAQKQLHQQSKNAQTLTKQTTETKGILAESNTNVKFLPNQQNDRFSASQLKMFKTNEATVQPVSQDQSLESKIRRERHRMQKKIKEKILFSRLQLCNSPQRTQLRQNYIESILSK